MWNPRRPLLLLFSTVLVALTIAACAPTVPTGVVVVVVDTLRADHLTVYGYPRPTSEQLAQWAEQGRVFERAFSTSPWTMPTMASMFTGQLPSTHRVGQWQRASSPANATRFGRRTPLGDDMPTLAQRLRDHGFATAAFVTSPNLAPSFGLNRGFDVYEYLPRRPGHEIVQAAGDWLETVGDRYFLLVHLIEPHLPYKPPAPIRGRFSETEGKHPPIKGLRGIRSQLEQMTQERRDSIVERYDEEIVAADVALGELRGRLELDGRLGRSLVIFTSDHGEELFDHGGFEHGHTLYQEVLRVPLVFWGPGVRPGQDDTPVSILDLPATILDAVGITQDRFSPGRTLWPLLLFGEPAPPGTLIAENMLYGPQSRSLLDWPWKLIVTPTTGKRQLFDLDTDPGETNDLASNRPEVVERMQLELDRQLEQAERKAGELAEPVELTPDLERELRALGYIEGGD